MNVTDTKTSKSAAAPGIRQIKLTFTVVIERDGESFHAYCPAFKGLHVDGRTEKEALKNATDAAHIYVNSLAAHRESLQVGPHCSVEEQIPSVPPGALLHQVEVEWPSLSTSGIS